MSSRDTAKLGRQTMMIRDDPGNTKKMCPGCPVNLEEGAAFTVAGTGSLR